MILSVSRRTDIPSFYSQWFVNRLRAGEVLVRNPMNPAQLSRICLSPDVVDCIVFWTKDPAPMLPRLGEIDAMGYRYYVQFTLTPYGRELEPGLRPKQEVKETFCELSRLIGPERVLWRYDPIVLNGEWDLARHRREFLALCESLEGQTDCCTISFVDSYAKLRKEYRSGLLREISDEEMRELAAELAAIARKHGMRMLACCEALDLTSCGVEKGHCIDGERVSRICGGKLAAKRDTAQRTGCGCVESVDVGSYDTCLHGCVYCYANRSTGFAAVRAGQHNPEGELLAGVLSPEDKVTVRQLKSLLGKH